MIKKKQKLPKSSKLIILLSLILSFITIYAINDQLRLDSEKHMEEVTGQISQKVDSKFKSHLDELERLARSLVESEESGKIHNLSDNIHDYASSTSFNSFHIVGLDGKTTCEKSSTGKEVDLHDRYYVQQALKGKSVVSEPMDSRIESDQHKDTKIVAFATPLKFDGEIKGALIGTMRLDTLKNYLNTNIYGFDSNIYVFDNKHQLIMTSISNEKTYLGMAERQKIDHKKVEIIKHGGVKEYCITRFLKDIDGWHVVATIPVKDVQYNTNVVLYITGGILIIINILIVAFAYITNKNKNKLEKIAYTDKVTGLVNMDYFIDEAPSFIKRNTEKENYMVSFEIANYKGIADLFGGDIAQSLIVKMAGYLNQLNADKVRFARFRDDLFYAILKVDSPKELTAFADKIYDIAMRSLMELTNMLDVNIKTNIGVTSIDEKEIDIAKAIDESDLARVANNNEDDAYSSYHVELLENRERDRQIQTNIKTGIDNEEFVVYYQPKVSPHTEKIVGMEALVRWNSDELGFVPPGQFIDVAERTGDITLITKYVLDCVCRDMHDWKYRGYQEVKVSVNISKVDLYQTDMLQYMKDIVKEYDIDPKMIEIELTESVVDFDINFVRSKIKEIKDLGFSISLDDFGTGTSSFSILQDIDVDVVKIDRMFVIDLVENKKSQIIVKSMVELSKRLGCEIVCEGVEDQEQVAILRDLDVEMIQGYVYFKPTPKYDLDQYLEKK